MNTSDVITIYLAARRAQGVQIRSGARALRQFARETGDRPLHDVTQQAVITFLHGHGALSASWMAKFRLLAGLYRFALTRGYVTASPLPEPALFLAHLKRKAGLPTSYWGPDVRLERYTVTKWTE